MLKLSKQIIPYVIFGYLIEQVNILHSLKLFNTALLTVGLSYSGLYLPLNLLNFSMVARSENVLDDVRLGKKNQPFNRRLFTRSPGAYSVLSMLSWQVADM